MVRSGLQQDVINLYRQGIRNAMSKPGVAREAFLLHWRYSFRHPQLTKRDYSAIEHQLRRLSKTLEMLEEPSVQRISVSDEMRSWWARTVALAQSRSSQSAPSSSPGLGSSTSSASSRTLYTASHPASSPMPIAAHARALHASATRRASAPASQGEHGGGGASDGPGNAAPDTAHVGETALEKGEAAGSSGEEKMTGAQGQRDGDKKGKGERGGEQWGGKLPGHGGT